MHVGLLSPVVKCSQKSYQFLDVGGQLPVLRVMLAFIAVEYLLHDHIWLVRHRAVLEAYRFEAPVGCFSQDLVHVF